MVEQEAVNFEVTGSSPVAGAKIITLRKRGFYFGSDTWRENQVFLRSKKWFGVVNEAEKVFTFFRE